jgi:hypothetical protein
MRRCNTIRWTCWISAARSFNSHFRSPTEMLLVGRALRCFSIVHKSCVCSIAFCHVHLYCNNTLSVFTKFSNTLRCEGEGADECFAVLGLWSPFLRPSRLLLRPIDPMSALALSHSISSHRSCEVQYRLSRNQGFLMVVFDFDIDNMNGAI